MEWLPEVAIALGSILAGVGATRYGPPMVRRLRGQPAHVHDWRLNSSETTNGKHVNVMVCWGHEQPEIQRVEVGEA